MKITLIVDYQNDFVNGTLGFAGAEKLDERIVARIEQNRKAGDFFVQTSDTHDSHYMRTREGKHLPIKHCIAGTDGWKTYGKTREVVLELLCEGNLYSIQKASFGVSPEDMVRLKKELRNRNVNAEDVEAIEVMGLVSNICVLSNVCVFQAAFPNAQIIVDSSLTDSFDKGLHEATMKVLRGLQVEVIEKGE